MSATEELRDAVREFLKIASPSANVRELMATDAGYDEAVWRQMAGELGLHGIAVPEEWGGAGAGVSELAVVFEEMGAALLCSPFFSTVALATQAILTSGDRGAMDVPPGVRRRVDDRDPDSQRSARRLGPRRRDDLRAP